MQGVRRLVANVVGRGFVLDSDSGDKGIDDVNGYRWAEWSRSPEACDDQQELDFHSLEKLTLQHVIIDGDICSLPNRDGGIESQEGHRLKTPRNTTKNVVHGVQQDERRRRLAYWFTKEDIEPWRSVVRVNDITQIPARDEAGHRQVFHHYLPDRRSQTRGVTAFAPMADTAGHWDDLGILAVNLDLPLCVFLLDASETNYSGFRGAIGQARQRWREIQSWMMASFHRLVYEWKVRQWAVTDSAHRKRHG